MQGYNDEKMLARTLKRIWSFMLVIMLLATSINQDVIAGMLMDSSYEPVYKEMISKRLIFTADTPSDDAMFEEEGWKC